MKITKEIFGTLPNGSTADLYTLEGKDGFRIKVSSFGGIITSIQTADRKGKSEEIALGFETLEEYVSTRFYFGAAIGRFGNRIEGGQFSLDGKKYVLTCNNGPNHLHGGEDHAFDRKNWMVTPFQSEKEAGLILTSFSPDGEEGYPGNLNVTMTYTITDQNELKFDYKAVSDKATPVNLTNHSYFNLGGLSSGPVLDHKVTLDCPWFLPVDKNQIPTGEILSVKGTPMDFTTEHSIGERIDLVDDHGYDHCYVLNTATGIRPFARVEEPLSGRVMEVSTDQPGVQFYTGNKLKAVMGKDNCIYEKNWGFCLETQLFPDCTNQTYFPSPVINPGQVYTHSSIYKFSVK
ncbi:MAG: hypothetical protein B6241_06195 [Spirochaetaceae bacterium 4572_59]|nr:MAG: hypothetical protein B6241_06195 [Spirochaetaceae bacterium 4572_59]